MRTAYLRGCRIQEYPFWSETVFSGCGSFFFCLTGFFFAETGGFTEGGTGRYGKIRRRFCAGCTNRLISNEKNDEKTKVVLKVIHRRSDRKREKNKLCTKLCTLSTEYAAGFPSGDIKNVVYIVKRANGCFVQKS